jgi:uncharacterized membrane protein YqhA
VPHARAAYIAASSSLDMFASTRTPALAARNAAGRDADALRARGARGATAGTSSGSPRGDTDESSRGTRAVARTTRAARASPRASPACCVAPPRARVLLRALRATSPAPSSRASGALEKRQGRLPTPSAYRPEVRREIRELINEKNDVLEMDSAATSFEPETAMRTMSARSLEETLDSRAVQRALANSVANALANRKKDQDGDASEPSNVLDRPLSAEESDAIGEKVVAALRAAAQRRRVGRQIEYAFVRSALAATNAFVLFGVCASLALSALLFTMGVREVLFDAVAAWIRFSPVELVTAAVGALDRFLLGMVCVIFGVGAFEVFLARVKTEKGGLEPRNAALRRLRWLNISSVDDLEQQVSGIVVAVLVVNILELSLHMTFNTPVDLVFAAMAPLACAGALALLHMSARVNHGDGAHGKKTMRSRKSRRDHEKSMDEEARHSAAAAGAR